jgi:hypothetical protein
MAPHRHAKVPSARWESQKETIKKMYLDRDMNLEGANGLIEYMATGHNLNAR